jgi:bisphosphoglycerate-dependent phosphoglycerate mutase
LFFFSSEWNQKNLFCGWYDADLSEKGFEEAIQAGKVRFYSFKTSQFIICFFF